MNTRHKICHVIVRLDTGGAETSLLRLAQRPDARYEHHVLCFGRPSPIGSSLARAQVPVTYCDYRTGPVALFRAWRRLRRLRPDVVQGWMYLGNLLAAILVRWGRVGRARLVFSIRQSPRRLDLERRRTRLAIHLGRLPGLRPDLLLYNSHAAVSDHAVLGYDRYPHKVIVNGIDTARYRPDTQARDAVRRAWSVGPAEHVVAMICRFHPLKGVDIFLAAAREVLSARDDVTVLPAGPGMEAQNPALDALLGEHGLDGRVRLLGPQGEVESLLPGIDLLVLASLREGTPNILLEASACGVGCVATDVGDVRRIILQPERIVAPGDVASLVTTINANLRMDAEDARRARVHICNNYHIEECLESYFLTYAELLAP
ncbi:MAG: glycosyltransferase [Pseudomonadota bacterium]